MRTFGSLCFVSTLKQGRDKFEARALPCIFLVYPFGKKAYKAFSLETNKLIISRDVVFHEHVFPFIDPSFNHKPTSLFNLPSAICDDEIQMHSSSQ